jgi:CMP/dCMP kinase
MLSVPVITFDGPSGTGKGTVAQHLACTLGWNYLDSGALYRSFAWAVSVAGLAHDDDSGQVNLVDNFTVDFQVVKNNQVAVTCQGEDISAVIRTEEIGVLASKLSSNPLIRKGLVGLQYGFRQPPGLVTDGRDMGTVIFPDAKYKFYLTATAAERAKRRYKQLQQLGISGILRNIELDLRARDERDKSRTASPMIAAQDAIVIDTTSMTIDDVMLAVLDRIR